MTNQTSLHGFPATVFHQCVADACAEAVADISTVWLDQFPTSHAEHLNLPPFEDLPRLPDGEQQWEGMIETCCEDSARDYFRIMSADSFARLTHAVIDRYNRLYAGTLAADHC